MWQSGPVSDGSSRSGRTGEQGGGPAGNRFDRSEALGRLASEQFDVLVIGGGITGAGAALDAASRGLRTALVERGDFASGTSSKSSKMVHGGLRYLQQREIRLVYENLAERQRLLENAPHLVSPLPFLIPLFGRDGVVAKAVARSYSSALWLYDLTGGLRIGSRHKKVTRSETLGHLPQLKTDHLVAGFLYFDARADDARLTLTVARTAVLDHGAVAANYLTAESFVTGPDGRVAGARVRSTIDDGDLVPSDPEEGRRAPVDPGVTPSGEGEPDGACFDVRAKVVINATGVWADEVSSLDETTRQPSLRPAKGVHVTVPARRLSCDIAAVLPVPHDRRSIFVVPWPEGELTYIGTTDTGYSGSLDDPRCMPEDVAYLLDVVNAATTAELTPEDITGVWAGLRPLLAPRRDNQRISERTSDLSRRHTVHTSAHGVVTVTGGKLTTYRKMAEDTVDEAVRLLGEGPRRCVTKRLKLHGAPNARDTPSTDATTRNGRAALRHLRARYGSEVQAVLALAETQPELLDPVVEGLPYLGVEVVYGARAEMAQTVADVLSRRTRAQLLQARASAAAAGSVADLLAPELGWTTERAEREASTFAAAALAELDTAGLMRPTETPLRERR